MTNFYIRKDMPLWKACMVAGSFLLVCICGFRFLLLTPGFLHGLLRALLFLGLGIVLILLVASILVFITEWVPDAFISLYHAWQKWMGYP